VSVHLPQGKTSILLGYGQKVEEFYENLSGFLTLEES
jgi:hypothetical protein